MNSLEKQLKSGLVAGLRRQALGRCSKWTETYRYTDYGPWRFDRHPWSKEMCDVDEDWVGMKAAQMAFTEVCLNRSLYSIDWLNRSVLYLLPSQTPDATNFSADRFDVALELSSYLRSMFSDVKNVGHKRAGSRSLYLRGARSRSGLKSVPAAVLVFDEFDEMSRDKVILAEERQSGQEEKQDIRISTPIVHGEGIHAEFEVSSQEHYEFKCLSCGQWQRLNDPKTCLVITADSLTDPGIKNSYYQCPHCKSKLPEDKSLWLNQENAKFVADKSDYLKRGFWVPQFYSFAQQPWRIARLALMAENDPMAAQEFYNSKLGLPYESSANRIQKEALKTAIDAGNGRTNGAPTRTMHIRTMGIDVGAWFHYVVCDWVIHFNAADITGKCICMPVKINKVRTVDALRAEINAWQPHKFCVDAHPELRLAKELVDAYPGTGKRVIYAKNSKARVSKNEDNTLQVGRSYWLDVIFNRFLAPGEKVTLPVDTPDEFLKHMRNIVKKFVTDETTKDVKAKFVTVNDDHYFHAMNYAEIALADYEGLKPSTGDIREDV